MHYQETLGVYQQIMLCTQKWNWDPYNKHTRAYCVPVTVYFKLYIHTYSIQRRLMHAAGCVLSLVERSVYSSTACLLRDVWTKTDSSRFYLCINLFTVSLKVITASYNLSFEVKHGSSSVQFACTHPNQEKAPHFRIVPSSM